MAVATNCRYISMNRTHILYENLKNLKIESGRQRKSIRYMKLSDRLLLKKCKCLKKELNQVSAELERVEEIICERTFSWMIASNIFKGILRYGSSLD